jgi:hypothetical protein
LKQNDEAVGQTFIGEAMLKEFALDVFFILFHKTGDAQRMSFSRQA